MSDALDAPLQEFQSDLQYLRHLLALIETLRDFGSTVPPDPVPTDAFGEKAQKLQSHIRSLSTDFAILSGTLVLYLAGRFEHFVRHSFESVCDMYAAKCQTFEDLPDKMQQSLLARTAEIVLAPKRYGFDQKTQVHNLVLTLAANIQAQAGLGPLNAACLSTTEANMHAETLAELYRRVGIQALWEEIGKQAKIKLHFEVGKDVDATTSAKARLNELMHTRNQIAHPSANTVFPAPDKVLKYAEFIGVLADVLTEVCRVQWAVFRAGV